LIQSRRYVAFHFSLLSSHIHRLPNVQTLRILRSERRNFNLEHINPFQIQRLRILISWASLN